MSILTLLFVALAAQDARPVQGPELAGVFQPAWSLPDSPPGEEDLARSLAGALPAEGGTLADRVARLVALREEPQQQEAELEALVAERPDVASWVGELVRDRRLFDERWHPKRDREDDGILLGEVLDRDRLGESWSRRGGSDEILQGAVLVLADLRSMREAEVDFAEYQRRPDADYEKFRAIQDSWVRGRDAAGVPFQAVSLRFRCDLPFPFGGYDCDLRVLQCADDEGRPRTRVYSPSKDFYWLAGDDVFLAVRDSRGAPVGWIVVRRYGFDLDGIPDGTRHREEALRGSLGGLKRAAERRFAESGRELRLEGEPVPPVPVTGFDD